MVTPIPEAPMYHLTQVTVVLYHTTQVPSGPLHYRTREGFPVLGDSDIPHFWYQRFPSRTRCCHSTNSAFSSKRWLLIIRRQPPHSRRNMHSPAMMAAVPEDPDSPIASEEALLQSPPLPHERVFYWGSGSPQAWRVLIALEEKGIPYRSVCVSFSSGVLKTPFFQALNPRMRIPVLVEPVDDDADAVESASATSSPFFGLTPSRQERVVLYESAAILEYLERRFPQPPCMPHNLHAFALAQTRLHEANEILSVVGDLVVYLRRFPVDKRNPAVLQAKWGALDAELAIWEAYFDGRPFLVSRETPYLCDFTLFTNIAYAVRCGLQLDGLYPRLAMFYVRLCARPSIEKTWPPHWKTTFGTKVLTKCFYCSGQGQCSCCPPSGNGDTNAASPK